MDAFPIYSKEVNLIRLEKLKLLLDKVPQRHVETLNPEIHGCFFYGRAISYTFKNREGDIGHWTFMDPTDITKTIAIDVKDIPYYTMANRSLEKLFPDWILKTLPADISNNHVCTATKSGGAMIIETSSTIDSSTARLLTLIKIAIYELEKYIM